MVFGDDDLKRLKQAIRPPMTISNSYVFNIGWLKALIARLEAAEKLAAWVERWNDHENCDTKCTVQKNVEAWRNAKGESGEAETKGIE